MPCHVHAVTKLNFKAIVDGLGDVLFKWVRGAATRALCRLLAAIQGCKPVPCPGLHPAQ